MINKKYFILLSLLTLALYSRTYKNSYINKKIEINLKQQRIYAKENGIIIFSGSISSGTRKHRTPTGNYRILEKDRYHNSSKYPEPYGGAKMPYMLRLTNSGIAIHQGYLPGYPASHGCIRVTKRTAKKLWKWTTLGTRVSIVQGYTRTTKKAKYIKKHKRPKLAYRSNRKYFLIYGKRGSSVKVYY
jgi:hypothetical protein